MNVDEFKLDVQGLMANVSALAEVAGLVKLSVVADVSLDRVWLTIKGVEVRIRGSWSTTSNWATAAGGPRHGPQSATSP